ncbi:MAG: hypothetical protein J5887_06875 [Erysipelotrichaceae bacterium]|nr:hypothetical protein [Erysipelotrichaceae bacterium]
MIHSTFTMRSVALDMDTKVDILLPEDRHKTEDLRGLKYPVLYILHGYKNDNSSWLHLSNIFLMCRDLNLIVVMPAVNNSMYTDEYYGQNYYTYITEELPMKLKNYLPLTDDPEQTFVMGESMGGYGTLKCALSKPENYGKAVCLSGANVPKMENNIAGRHYNGVFGLEGKDTLNVSTDINVLIDQLAEYDGHKPKIMFYCGTEDIVYESCYQMAQKLKTTCPEAFAGEEYWPGEHNYFFWNQAIPKALKFFGFEVKQDSVI